MKGKITVYTCGHGHKTITIDSGNENVPKTIECRQKTDCGNRNCTEIAAAINIRNSQGLNPEYEWYKPGKNDKLNFQQKQFLRNSGFLLRKINKPVFNPNLI